MCFKVHGWYQMLLQWSQSKSFTSREGKIVQDQLFHQNQNKEETHRLGIYVMPELERELERFGCIS